MALSNARACLSLPGIRNRTNECCYLLRLRAVELDLRGSYVLSILKNGEI